MRPLFVAAGVLALAGCTLDGPPSVTMAQPRGATVAFDSIDGPPPAQFQKLVADLNSEAQTRRLAVISRDKPAAYRVRGYLAAQVAKNRTTVSWAWDVFDTSDTRTLRITGEETAKNRKGWQAVDDAMLARIAQASMEKLTAFLTSPEVAPGAPAPEPQIAFIGERKTTPEQAGIFRIFTPADPLPADTTEATPAAMPVSTGAVPLPRKRPADDAAVSSRETLDLAASRAHKR